MSDKNGSAKIVKIGKWAVTADPDMLNKVLADAIKPRDEMHLGRWIKHDTWTSDEATLLLNGLDPDRTRLVMSNQWINFPTGEFDFELNAVAMLDGRAFEPEIILGIEDHLRGENACSTDAHSFADFKERLRNTAELVVEMRKLLNSGTRPDKNPPSFYIEWAVSKGFSGKWIEAWKKKVFPTSTDANASALEESFQTEQNRILDITRYRGCKRMILENWEKVRIRYGKNADARQVRIILKENIDTGVDKIPALKTVQNKLHELRSENLIP